VRTDVSALFIDPMGPYPKLVADCWDEARDARNYAGPNPVVAHPPCQLWTNFAALNFKRYGGTRNRPGNDNGCFASALTNVRKFGGVLEHPYGSHAWSTFALPKPDGLSWKRVDNEWVCEVWQSAYGHKARKRTWLLYCGKRDPSAGRTMRLAGTHQCGWFDRLKPVLSKAEASRTPVAFAEWLISLAALGEREGGE
jgi:hypothetical protein